MKNLVFSTALGAACLALAACGDREANTAETTDASATGANVTDGGDGSASASATFPTGARIVEENDVTYRIDPDGTRVRLGPTDSRIVVEDGVRYRVDPDGARVRIGPEGAVIDLPDVNVGINEKGNLDVDVGDRDPDRP
jgi:hypothetical protein